MSQLAVIMIIRMIRSMEMAYGQLTVQNAHNLTPSCEIYAYIAEETHLHSLKPGSKFFCLWP